MMDTICINCPMGCQLHIDEKDGIISVEGNTCKRGEVYGKEEYTHPRRTVTTLIRLKDGSVASCKTSGTVPKENIFDVVNFVSELTPESDVRIGDRVAENILGLGVDIIITGTKR